MENIALTELSNDDLLAKRKTIIKTQTMRATIVGALVGVAVYSAVKNGIGFFTFFPLFFVFLIVKNRSQLKAVDQEIAARGLRY